MGKEKKKPKLDFELVLEYNQEEESDEVKDNLFGKDLQRSPNKKVKGTPMLSNEISLYDAMMREMKVEVFALNHVDLDIMVSPDTGAEIETNTD